MVPSHHGRNPSGETQSAKDSRTFSEDPPHFLGLKLLCRAERGKASFRVEIAAEI